MSDPAIGRTATPAEGRYPGSAVAALGTSNGCSFAVAASSRTVSAGRIPNPGRYPG